LLIHIKWRAEFGGVWEHGAEENIWTKEGWNDRRLE
jgi:hypothetical protein